MVVPSKQEAFGQTASEAMSCGTPVVAFNTTGLKDIIDHKVNGYKAVPFEPTDLARGIKWVLDNNHNNQLSLKARKKIENNFSEKVVVKKILDVYKSLLLL